MQYVQQSIQDVALHLPVGRIEHVNAAFDSGASNLRLILGNETIIFDSRRKSATI